MTHRKSVLVAALLTLVLVLGMAVPALAHTGVSKSAGSMTVSKVEPYRVKLANGTYTTYRTTVRKGSGTYYYFSTAGTYVDQYNERPFSGPHKSGMPSFRTYWAQKQVTMWNARYYVEYASIKRSGTSTYLRVAKHIRYGYTGYAE